MIALDSPRRELKETLIKLIVKEGGIPDIVKKTLSLLESKPEHASLKGRIKYPHEIDEKLTDDLDASHCQELIALSAYYKNNSNLNVRVSSDLIEPYLVTQNVALKLLSLNKYGDITKSNARGNHPVISLGGLHLKGESEDYPLNSGMEMSVYLLHTLLLGEEIGPCLAPTSLLKFENVHMEEPLEIDDRIEEAAGNNQRGMFFITHPDIQRETVSRTFFLQAATTVIGKSLEEHLENLPPFDEENFSALVLCSFLTIPTDYKPDNFFVTFEKVAKIIGIDNDMAFAYPITMAGKKHMVDLKNALYFFEEMMDKPVAPKVRDRFSKLDPVLLGIEWAAAVFQQTQKYDQMGHTLRFTKSTLHQLIKNLQTLKKVLAAFENVTHRQLFRLLFPVVERFYQSYSQSTSEKVERLFSIKIGIVEDHLNGREKLEDGRTIKEALDATEKEQRDTPINTLCYELLKTLDLSTFTVEKQCAILTLAARYFPNLEPHPSWRNNNLPFHLIDLSALPFLQKLGIDLQGKNSEGDTILHVLIKQGRELSGEVLSLIPFEILNEKKQTPLDLAMKGKMADAAISLIRAGAGEAASSTLAWVFYDFVQKHNYPPLTEAFQTLIKRNSLLEWKIARETIFPSSGGCTQVQSPLHGMKTLHRNAFDQLWKNGIFQKINKYGRRQVGKANLEGFTIFFKPKPELPGVEQAVNTLIHQIMGFGAPHSDLVKMNGIPYLVTQGIPGPTLYEVLRTQPDLLQKMNKRRLSQLILLTMVINPEDGKPDNYIFSPLPNGEYQVVSIDNDHSFVPSVAAQYVVGGKKICVQVKTILYCLDQMFDPIDPSVKEQFLMHDPAEIMTLWLGQLSSLHGLYMDAFSEEERTNAFNNHGTFIGIPFREEMIAALYRKLVKIQFILDLEKNNPRFSHFDLLMKIDPPVAQRYIAGLKMKVSPLHRFLAIDGKDYELNGDLMFSTNQAKEILVSYNIVTKTDMAQLISTGAAFDPEKALQKLQEVIKQDRLVIIEQEKVDFSSLNEQKISELLKRTPFSKIQLPAQQSILRQIRRVAWKELSLTFAPILNNEYLKGLDFTKVVSLNLSYCQRLTDQVVGQIVNAAPNLEKLNLSGLQSFTQIQGTTGIFYEKALEINKITHLFLNNCPKLVTLNITGKQLVMLECEGGSLTRLEINSPSLTHLNIKNNKRLTPKSLDDFTTVFCPQLSRINLEGCDEIPDKELRDKFPWFPFSAVYHKNRQLIIELLENKITELKSTLYSSFTRKTLALAINANSSLRSIKLENSDLFYEIETLKNLFNALTEHKTITSISIDRFSLFNTVVRIDSAGIRMSERMNSFNSGIEILARGLKKNHILTSLKITRCNIGISGVKALVEYINLSPSLTTLDLRSNAISRWAIQFSLAYALQNNKVLQSLNLSENPIGDWGAMALAAALEKNYTLASLNLSSCNIGFEGAKALAKTLNNNLNLCKLNLNSNPIGTQGAIVIADALEYHPITHLDLGGVKIGIEGVTALAAALKGHLTLTSLNLSDNNIDDEGAKIIAEAIKDNKSLVSLDLSKNNISDAGAKIIAEATSLDSLDISMNSISDAAAVLIAEALKNNEALRSLNLSENQISDSGAAAIAQALIINKTLLALDLSANEIKDLGAIEIADALTINKTLLILYLHRNWLEQKGAQAFTEALKYNNTLSIFDLSRILIGILESRIEHRETFITIEALSSSYKFTEASEKLLYVYSNQEQLSLYISRKESIRLEKQKHPRNEEVKQWTIPPQSIEKSEDDFLTDQEELSTASPTVETLFLQGRVLEQKELPAALPLYLEAALEGHVEALQKLHTLNAHFHLGCYYEHQKENDDAACYYSLATAEGDLDGKEALNRLASTHPYAKSLLANWLEGRNIDKALVLHKEAASEGVEISKLHLGRLYYMGFSTESDQKEARSWIEKANLDHFPKENLVKKALLEEIQAKEEIIRNNMNIDQKLYRLSCFSKVTLQSKEQEELLNQKKKSVHEAFKTKMSHIFAAVDAILSDSAIPSMVLISQYAIEKVISREKNLKRKCRRLQSYHLDPSVLASGFVFRFQELIHKLDAKSLERFTDHYTLIFTDYLFAKAPDDATPFDLLMGGALQKVTPLNRFLAQKLKTDKGIGWTIEDLYFSSGLRTLYGGVYHPKETDALPFYRWGTREEVEILESMGMEMVQIEEERIDHLVAKVDRKLAAARYLQEAESLAKQYLV